MRDAEEIEQLARRRHRDIAVPILVELMTPCHRHGERTAGSSDVGVGGSIADVRDVRRRYLELPRVQLSLGSRAGDSSHDRRVQHHPRDITVRELEWSDKRGLLASSGGGLGDGDAGD